MGGSNGLIERAAKDEAARSLAICLVSGGMDSCVTAAIAHQENDELGFLHVSYGQRTEVRERRAFSDLANHFGVKRRLVASIGYLKLIGGGFFTNQTLAWFLRKPNPNRSLPTQWPSLNSTLSTALPHT